MNSRVLAFFQEFRGRLERIVEMSRVREVKVERVDLELMASSPKWFYGLRDEEIIVLDNKLNKLATVGVRQPVKFSFWHTSTWFIEKYFDETVGEAISRLEEPNRACSILRLELLMGKLTLFKPPKEFTFRGWLDASPDRAAIRSEIAAIDALAK